MGVMMRFRPLRPAVYAFALVCIALRGFVPPPQAKQLVVRSEENAQTLHESAASRPLAVLLEVLGSSMDYVVPDAAPLVGLRRVVLPPPPESLRPPEPVDGSRFKPPAR